MPQNDRRRKQAAARARATLPRRRRSSSGEILARRVTVAIGVVVALSLVIALVGTYDGNRAAPAPTADRATSPNDPNRLIAAATANPNDADSIGQLADYFGRTGQYQRALELYTRYGDLRPNDAQAHVSIGELSLSQGDAGRAQAEFARTLALNPTPQTAARAHLGLGSIYANIVPPRITDAQNEFNQAITLDPTGEAGGNARDQLVALSQVASATYAISPGVTVVVAPPPTVPRSTPTATP